MEKTIEIPQKDFRKGVYIELECCMCSNWHHAYELSLIGKPVFYSADTEKELSELLKEEGWKELHSDEYGLQGYWCGCDYMDE